MAVGGEGGGCFWEEGDDACAFFVAVSACVAALDAEDVGFGVFGDCEGGRDGADLDPELAFRQCGPQPLRPRRVVV